MLYSKQHMLLQQSNRIWARYGDFSVPPIEVMASAQTLAFAAGVWTWIHREADVVNLTSEHCLISTATNAQPSGMEPRPVWIASWQSSALPVWLNPSIFFISSFHHQSPVSPCPFTNYWQTKGVFSGTYLYKQVTRTYQKKELLLLTHHIWHTFDKKKR